MKKILSLFLWSYFSAANACVVVDDLGNTVKLSKPAERIISLAPDLTEILFTAGAGSQIVGVMQGSDFPENAKKIPVIASYNSVNSEAILALHPDLIVAWAGGDSQQQLEVLKRLGIPIFLSYQKDIKDIPHTLQRLGCLAGTEQIATTEAKRFSQRMQMLEKKYKNKKNVSVFYLLASHPLLTVNRQSWINQIITLCGGRNIFAEGIGVTPQVNMEAVIKKNPLVIISTQKTGWQLDWQAWPQMDAVRLQHLFSIEPDWMERAGPRLLDGAEIFCRDVEISRQTVNK